MTKKIKFKNLAVGEAYRKKGWSSDAVNMKITPVEIDGDMYNARALDPPSFYMCEKKNAKVIPLGRS